MDDFKETFSSIFNVGDALKKIQGKVSNVFATGEAGAGDVKAHVNGKRELIKIEIDDSLFTKENKGMLQDLIVGAVNAAMSNITEKVKEEIVPSELMDIIANMNSK